MPHVVSCLLVYDGKLLILKRSKNVRTYKGFWGVVAGYIEAGEKPFETALKEIREEVGLGNDDVELEKKGKPVKTSDVYKGKRYEWIIYPFIFKIKKKDKVQIDWEHSEYRWISPDEITHYKTVPHLKEIIREHLM